MFSMEMLLLLCHFFQLIIKKYFKVLDKYRKSSKIVSFQNKQPIKYAIFLINIYTKWHFSIIKTRWRLHMKVSALCTGVTNVLHTLKDTSESAADRCPEIEWRSSCSWPAHQCILGHDWGGFTRWTELGGSSINWCMQLKNEAPLPLVPHGEAAHLSLKGTVHRKCKHTVKHAQKTQLFQRVAALKTPPPSRLKALSCLKQAESASCLSDFWIWYNWWC